MENPEVDRSTTGDEGNQLNRNRSFKSKQLVRSQAIRESTSPPRTVSPSLRTDDSDEMLQHKGHSEQSHVTRVAMASADSSLEGDAYCRHGGKQRVEIQITSNSWDNESGSLRRRGRGAGDARDLLSNNPRVACICGACSNCPYCRGRRRKYKCPTKQDSGIVCPDDCPDYSDSEHNGTNDIKKSNSGSLDVDDQNYCRCAERKDKPKNMSMNRNDSEDRNELLGSDLVCFIKETLNKNARDRTALLKIEKELHCFINDTGRCIVKFPVMSSYGRMLVHRCAALFQLAHHLDQTNKTCVVVSKSGTSGGRIPCTSFKTWCVATLPPSPMRHQQDLTHAKSILKRDSNSLDASGGAEGALARSKSLEQREKDYERVRRRIFSEDNCHHDESQWPWAGPIKLLTPEHARNKLLKVQSLENPSMGPVSGCSNPVSWRGAVSKSHSFGGYGDNHQPRALSRQGDLASSSWRLSPSSSGYKTLSLRSTDSVTPSPTGGGTPEPGGAEAGAASGALVWAVTDFSAVPHGALVIHPQTGRPLTNPDGSVYHFDPANPPVLYDPNVYVQTDGNKIDQNNEKRRGRLEKEQSFIDSDNECQSSEECRNKCCCECRKQESNPTPTNDKPTEKETPKPESPQKSIQNEPTNSRPTPEISTNQKAEQDLSTNQRSDSQYRSYELANQREAGRQDMVHYNTAYTHPYTEEMSQAVNPYMGQEMGSLPLLPSAKVAPMPIQDPNIRPMSLTNVVYQPMQQAYSQYMPNTRIDQLPHQMYQQMIPQTIEEPKPISTSPHRHENTFRIDPSYPYPAVDYSACGGCMDTLPPRSFSVPYGQVEMPSVPIMPPAYPVHNLVHMPHYPVQYQEPVQWGQMCPVVYPQHYGYNLVYPQVVQQPYQICQPVYPVVDKEPAHAHTFPARNRTSVPASRTTPNAVDRKFDERDLNRQNSTDIAVKIQQIKEQMAQMNTGRNAPRRDEWRRNSGHGILGSCPSGHTYQRANTEDGQLSSAARAIVNSIRNMQSKNTYQQDRRSYDNSYRHNRDDNRRHRYDRDDKQTDRHGNPDSRSDMNGRGDGDRKFDPRPRVNQPTVPFRPPYLIRQMSPGTWCRRSPAPMHPGVEQPRRAPPDNRQRR